MIGLFARELHYCGICGLMHVSGTSMESPCTIALKAELSRLRGVLERIHPAIVQQAEYEFEQETRTHEAGDKDHDYIQAR